MLTSCQIQREGLVRIWTESESARGTHFLSSAERTNKTSQNIEQKKASKGHSHPVGHEQRGTS